MPLIPVDMRQEPLFERADRWVYNVDGDVRVTECPAVEEFPTEVDDPDPIGLARRLDRAFPHSDPTGLRRQFEVREVALDASVLLVNV